MEIKFENLKVLFTRNEIENRIKEIANKLNEKYKEEEVYAICVLKGAVMFAAELVKYLKCPVKMEFIKLSSYQGTKTSGKVEAVDILLPDLNGKNVLIIEDIIDTGLTAKFLTDYIKANFKTKSAVFCSLLNKNITGKVGIEPDYFGFEINNEFVVGYGLDYNEYYRNLDYIAYLPENLLY